MKNKRNENNINRFMVLRLACLLAVEIIIFLIVNYRVTAPIESMVFSVEELYELNQNSGVQFKDDTLKMKSNGNAVVLRSPNFILHPGSYSVKMQYESDKDGRGSILENTGSMIFYQADGDIGLYSDVSQLSDAKHVLESRIIVSSPDTMKDIFFVIVYEGEGTLAIHDIHILEYAGYRMLKAIITLLIFIIIDLVFIIRCLNKNDRIFSVIIQMGIIAIIASLPLLTDYLYVGQDSYFHLNRINMLAEEFKNGQFPVRITRNYFMNQYGYINSLFYCDIFLYIPAALFNCGLSLASCYKFYVVSINLFTTIIAYYSFGRITKSSTISIIGSAIYTLSSYRIVCIYTRVALGEYTAMTFLPLIIAGIYLIYTNEKIKCKDWILLSFGMSGVILSHVLTTQMIISFLIVFCICLYKQTFNKVRIIVFLKAAVITLMLTAWFVVPMLHSMQMEIAALQKSYKQIQSEGLYLAQIFSDPISNVTNGSIKNSMQDMPLTLGYALTFGFLYVIYCLVKSREWDIGKLDFVSARAMKVVYAFSVLAIVLTLHIFPWDSLDVFIGTKLANFLCTIQFPWRYLSFATALLSVAVILALQLFGQYKQEYFKIGITLLITFTIISTGSYYGQYIARGPIATGISVYNGEGIITNTEYRLSGIVASDMEISSVLVEDDALVVQNYRRDNGNAVISLFNSGENNLILTLPIQNYDNYILRDILTCEQFNIYSGKNRCISTVIPPHYEGTLELSYKPPITWRIAEAISLLTIIGIAVYLYKVIRKRREKIC